MIIVDSTGVATTSDLPEVVARALAGNRCYHVDFDRSTGYNDDDVRTERPAEDCNVVTSEIAAGWAKGMHRILIDLDVPAAYVPSSTPGHGHLYIDTAAGWPEVSALLDALVAVGAVEDGYRNASQTRQHTALRMPHVRKEPNHEQ